MRGFNARLRYLILSYNRTRKHENEIATNLLALIRFWSYPSKEDEGKGRRGHVDKNKLA